MLTHLHIQNYSLISHLDIDFRSGFSSVTGETGAGKSIILGALNLAMGARADAKTITDGEQRCQIEATFHTAQEGDIIVRRELNANGRSRSFVNDELITAAELKALSARLIDIHSQHENLLLNSDHFQLSVVDAIASNAAERDVYQSAYDRHAQATAELQEAQKAAQQSSADADYMTFQLTQLQEANLVAGEMAELEDEVYRLSHAEQIRNALDATIQHLESEGGILAMLHDCQLSDASKVLEERLRSAEIELKDIAHEAARQADMTDMDQDRLTTLQQRLDMLQSLMMKHHVRRVEELIAIRDQLAKTLHRIDNYEAELTRLGEVQQAAFEAMQSAAKQLTETRVAVADTIAQHLIRDMRDLGVMHTNVAVDIRPADQYDPDGHDMVQFLFAANLNQPLKPVCDVASGGEIARLMLCIKALVACTSGLPTIIFDEIDTGVSGQIASRMGEIMRRMADDRQIIAITHLPQIAAKAHTQYRVFKEDTTLRTETHIQLLTPAQRTHEIATMLSGANPSQEAIATAQQLLNQ